MAYTKTCDECGKILGNDGTPFIQIHGSISDQVEHEDGRVHFRYLTPHAYAKLAFCNEECEFKWRNHVREERKYIERQSYPQV